MATVIDEFVVKYTLDTKDLDKGTRNVEKRLNEVKTKSKEAGDSLGDSLEAGAKRASGSLGVIGSMLGKGGVVGLAFGSLIYAGKLLDDRLFKIAQSTRRLGIDSKNFGTAANNMRNLQYASEIAGGSMEDATQTVADLSKSLFNLKFNGQVSESLVMLSRLGVQFQDSYGRARDFNDVMLDTASAIERAKSAGRMTDAEAFQFASQAGFTGGMAQIVTGGRANAERELVKQQNRRQVSGTDVNSATNWVRGSISLGQATEAGVGVKGMSAIADERGTADEKIEQAGSYFKDAVETFGNWVSKLFGGGTSAAPVVTAPVAPATVNRGPSALTRGLRNNNPLNLKALKGQNADADGFRIFNTMEEGIRAADNQLSLNELRGTDTVDKQINKWAPASDNNDVAAYLASIKKQTGLDAGSKTSKANHAQLIAAMAMHESGSGAPGVGQVNAALGMGPQNFGGIDRGGGNSTSVQIGDINIHTQATDANAIANNIGDLTKRKLLAAHAETGTM